MRELTRALVVRLFCLALLASKTFTLHDIAAFAAGCVLCLPCAAAMTDK